MEILPHDGRDHVVYKQVLMAQPTEGLPVDIQKFDDVRVGLLSEPPYVRMFGMTAPFEGLEAHLTMDAILPDEQV